MFNTMSKPLLVLDLANNHNGSVEHGKRIISDAYEAVKGLDFDVAIKFQYRDPHSYINPDFRGDWSNSYIKRFEETRLSDSEYHELTLFSRNLGFMMACTPFDETSARKVKEQKFDLMKVASASFTDWPLLAAVAEMDMPTIASTGGASVEMIDRVSAFLTKRLTNVALMHCVAEYPTEDKNLNLLRIGDLRHRYPGVVIGYSTHEDPKNNLAGPLAMALGAQIFERHIGADDNITLKNKYSSDKVELRNWALSLRKARELIGFGLDSRISEKEAKTIRGLQRGVYSKKSLQKNVLLESDAISLSFPVQEGQLSASDLSLFFQYRALRDFGENEPILIEDTKKDSSAEAVELIVSSAKTLFHKAAISLPKKSILEISHHYGLEKFWEFGAVIVEVINREYCKKILVIFGNQKHPEHFHKQKEETFLCINGVAEVTLDGVEHKLFPGDLLTVPRLAKHSFTSSSGAVIEEISSRHFNDDSFYTDPQIQSNVNRKTRLSIWGSEFD